MTTLYNLRHDGDQYRITKWIDGNPEASYLCDAGACECPAGVRPTCRHRQMLPMMLDRHLANSTLFWDFDNGHSCDINGNPARQTVVVPEGLHSNPSPHSVAASTPDFDSGSTGSNPVGATKPATWRRL